MRSCVCHAYAKVNLSLAIVGQRPDGYHLLDMTMQSLSLFDVLRFTTVSNGIRIHCNWSLPLREKNIAYRAAQKMMEAAGVKHGVAIELEKHIPTQAGLGGGSADAAAVLLGLNALWELGFSQEELSEMGLALGADVPFCLQGGTARAQGVGEVLVPAHVPKPMWFLLTQPQEGLSTARMFAAYHDCQKGPVPDTEAVLAALAAGDLGGVAAASQNVFEPAARGLCPALDTHFELLASTHPVFVRMTGSGSVVYGVYEEQSQALAAKEMLQDKVFWVEVAASAPHGVEMHLD